MLPDTLLPPLTATRADKGSPSIVGLQRSSQSDPVENDLLNSLFPIVLSDRLMME